MAMQTVHFTYDPIFIVQRITEIIHEQSELVRMIPVNEKLYTLTREHYDLLFDDYLEHIKYDQEELTITKEFLTGFHKHLIELMDKDIKEYDARHSDYYIFDKSTNTYYIHEFGSHTDMLVTILSEQFKSVDGMTKDNLTKYIEFNYEFKGANDEYSMTKFVVEVMFGHEHCFGLDQHTYTKVKVNKDKSFEAHLNRLKAKKGE